MKRIKIMLIIALLIIAACVYLFTDISAYILIVLALITVIMYFSGFLKQEKTYDPKDRKLIKKVKKIAAQSQTTEEFKNKILSTIDRPEETICVKIYVKRGRIRGEITFCRDADDLEIEL